MASPGIFYRRNWSAFLDAELQIMVFRDFLPQGISSTLVTPWSQDLWSCDLAHDLTHDPPTSSRSKQTLSHYYQTRHRHSRRETSIKPTALEARRGHHQLVDQCSKTSTNSAIIFINAIYKEFYKCWSRCPARA